MKADLGLHWFAGNKTKNDSCILVAEVHKTALHVIIYGIANILCERFDHLIVFQCLISVIYFANIFISCLK